MLIVSDVDSNRNLVLSAYTFDRQEFHALELTLERSGVSPVATPIPADQAGREGRRYLVPSASIAGFGRLLGGAFTPNGQFQPQAAPGNPYACEEIVLHGTGSGCETITASDLAAARAACGLVANRRGWFGSVPRAGRCQP